MNLLTLSGVLQLDKKQYDDGLNQAEGQAESSGSKIGSAFKKVGKVAVAGFSAIGGATIGATTAFVKSTGAVAEYGDNIDKMSQKLGISSTAYQEWDAIMQHSGTSIDSMTGAMKVMSVQAEKGSDAFQKLGISQEEMANMNQEELFSKVISGLQGMEEGTERTALATQLLGRGAVELGPLLNTSAEETEAMRQKVHELGGVMSDEGVKAAAKYQDTLQDMKTGFDGLKRGLVSEFLPAVTEVMDGLTDIFSGNTSEGLKKISSGVDDMVKGISDALPKVVEVGAGIIESLAGAVINNAPKLFEAGMNLVFQLSTSIIENLPKLVTVALTLIQTFATGIADALPTLIPTIVDVVLQIVDILTQPDTLTNLLGAALQIIIALAEGLVEAIPKLADAVPKIINNLTKFIQNNLDKIILAGIEITAKLAVGLIKALPSLVKAAVSLTTAIPKAIMTTDWLKVGSNIIHGIVKGLKDAGHAIKDFLLDLMKGAVDGVKKFFGIHSPSRKMRKEVGFQVGAGMALGIKDSASMVEDAMEGLETIPSTGKFGMNDFNVTGSSGYGSSNGGVSGIGGQTYIINVNQPVSTPDEMARAIRLESQYGLLEGGAI